jgi:hypothetical protein
MRTLVNDIRTQHNALCTKLDADATVPGAPGFWATFQTAVPAAAASTINLEHVANGGSYTHGDDAVRLRVFLQGNGTLLADLITKHNLLVAALDAAVLSLNTYVSVGAATDASGSVSALTHFAQGASSTHGDAGVQVKLLLQGGNDLKAKHNATLTNLNLDTVPTDNNYVALLTVSAPNM